MQEPLQRPLVSIITIVKNRALTLPRVVASVLGQTYAPIEYIVVDGGSTDGGLEVLRSFGARISRIIFDQGNGIARAFNAGIRASRGRIIGMQNADDWYEPTAVERAVAVLGSAGLCVSHGSMMFHDAHGQEMLCHGTPAYLSLFNSMNHPTVFVRRQCFDRIGLFCEDLEYAVDYEWFLRLRARGGRFLGVPEPVSHMATGGMCTVNVRDIARENYRVRSQYGVAPLLNMLLFSVQVWQKVVRKRVEQRGWLPVWSLLKQRFLASLS